MMTVVLASSNQGKCKEFAELLKGLSIDLIPQSAFKVQDAQETGLTFIENALIKARHAAQETGLPALADDSGLVVDALNGEPGIYSARYAGEEANAKNNIEKLLQAMQGVKHRQAAFHCVLAFMRHAKDPTPIICHGKWQGLILDQARGVQGFGYDPIFYLPSEQKSVAELDSSLKNRLSHRAMAFNQLMKQLLETT